MTAKQIQAKKVCYRGIQYRSTLEAKTAQSLDNLGIPYQYEPDGYQLTNGVWYKPDFYLPGAKQFIECKGVMSTEDSAKNTSTIKIGYKATRNGKVMHISSVKPALEVIKLKITAKRSSTLYLSKPSVASSKYSLKVQHMPILVVRQAKPIIAARISLPPSPKK